MKKTISALFLLSALAGSLHAQDKLAYEKYTWEENPKPATLTADEEKDPAVVVKDTRIIQFAYESQTELVMYTTRHQVTRVNNEKGIEQMSKLYIPTSGIIDVLNIKARSISKDGKVTMLNKSNIKDVENFENQGPFKIFAFEGVEQGSTIEYLYTIKRPFRAFGSEHLQGSTRRNNVTLEFISPSNLVYEARVYNSSLSPVVDTLEDGSNHILLSIPSVTRLNRELYSAYDANLMRVEYKLAYNKSNGKGRLFTWDDAAGRLYETSFTFDKKELKAVDGLIKDLKLAKLATDEEKVKTLESYIKTNILIGQGAEFGRVDEVLSKKAASEQGAVRLFIAAFKRLNIAVELVATTDRFERRFDPDFDTWTYIDDQFLNLKDLGIYLEPTEQFGRMGYITAEITGTKGFFINEVTVGEASSATAKVKDIKALPVDKTNHFVDVKVDFSSSIEEPAIRLEQRLTGYSAANIQPIYNYMNQEQKDELSRNLMKLFGEDTKVIKGEILNTEEADLFVKPLVVKGDVMSPGLMEKAGNKYLFKIGTLIGPQSELYQEEKRQQRAEIHYKHGFTRELEFTIPDGYTITNPEDLKISAVCKEGDKVTAEFKSTYEISGNVVKVHIVEIYDALVYPMEIFEDFRKVINAAADFNKVTLILEKK